jgi:WD40 repeat protein
LDKSDGREIRKFGPIPLGQNFDNLRYSNPGKWVIGVGATQVRIWDYQSGRERKRYTPPSPVKGLDLHPNGRWVVSIHEDHVIRIWDALSGDPVAEAFPDESRRIARIRFSPDERQLLCLPRGRAQFYIVSPERGRVIRTMDGALTNVLDAVFVPNNPSVASVHADSTLRVWDIATGRNVYSSRPFDKAVRSLSISPDGHHLVILLEGEAIVYRSRR